MTRSVTLSDPNYHIFEYLAYYCDNENSFDFAVMLRGPWGVGKTFLIQDFIEERKRSASIDDRTLYVTLYGVTSYQQIDDQLFRQMHPILASKGAKFAAQVAKGLLKSTLKIDLIGDESASIDAKLPDISLRDYIVSPNRCVIVFDDLERCGLPTPEVLGYINAFVEHERCKVIIVANEDDILRRTDDRYKDIKEKLIGQTVEVHPTTESALRGFLSSIRTGRVEKFLNESVPFILSVHAESATSNLRILKQTLWDFERCASCLTDAQWNNAEARRALLGLVLAVSSEVRAGRLSVDDMGSLGVSKIVRAMSKEDTAATRLEDRYPDVDFDQKVISITSLRNLLFQGWIDREAIRRELEESAFFADPGTTPAWQRVCMFWRNSDDEVAVAVEELKSQFAERAFRDVGQFFLIFGLWLLLSKMGVVEWSRRDVVSQCKKYLRDLERAGDVPVFIGGMWELDNFPGWGGFAYVEIETKEFEELVTYFKIIVDRVYKRALPALVDSLIDLMRHDAISYARQICINNVVRATYWNVPILASVKVKIFVDALLSVDPTSVSTILGAMKSRYQSGILDRELSSERAWLISMKRELERRAARLPALSRYRIRSSIRSYIDPFLTLALTDVNP